MRTEKINIYQFSELSEEAKQKAIEAYRENNLDYDWYDSVYQDFKMLCDTLYIDIAEKRKNDLAIYFRLSYSQGDGSSFDSDIDVLKFISAVNSESWREHCPKDEYLPNCLRKIKIPARILNQIENGNIDLSVGTETSSRDNFKVSYSYNLYNYNTPVPLVEAVIEDVLTDVEHNLTCLNGWLFDALTKECEWLQSDEQIIESIEANELEFTEDGERY